MKHGLDIQDGSQADRYVAKWGLPEEMSKGHMKRVRMAVIPLSICWSCLLKINRYTVVNCLLNYFKEYAIVMKRATPTCLGSWSEKFIRIDEKTDEEHAEETEKNAIELTSVADYGFTLLTVFQKRHVFLDCVSRDYEQNDGFSSANALLDELHFKYLEIQQSKQLE